MVENLIKLGFSEKEAKVYLVLLRHGPSLASTVAHRTGLKRVSVYSILDTLAARGVISFENTDMGRRYLPHDPECLLYDLEQEKAQLQLKWELARECVKSLSQPTALHALDARRVIFLKGLKNIEDELQVFLEPTRSLYLLMATSLSAEEDHLLQALLQKKGKAFKKLRILSPEQWCEWAKYQGVLVKDQAVHPAPAQQGHIWVQGHSVFFLTQKEDLELMLIRDAEYAKTVLQTMILPYCKSSGVLADTSTISSLKG